MERKLLPSKKPRSRNLDGRWRRKRSDTGIPRGMGACPQPPIPTCADRCPIFKEYKHKGCDVCPSKAGRFE